MPTRLRIDVEKYNGNTLIMPAYLSQLNALGTKIVSIYQNNKKYDLSTTMGIIIINDPETGFPKAIMDGTYITALRTGAAGAVASKYLSRKDASIATIIGAGVQGSSQLMGLCEVRDIKRVYISDINQKMCKDYIRSMDKQYNIEFIVTKNLEKSVRESDIIITATSSSDPVFKEEWINEGCHITGIGSHSPNTREIDENIFIRNPKIVLDTWDAKDVGDIAFPIHKGILKIEDIYGEIGEIVVGKKKGRVTDEEITIFKSVGMAITDVSTASMTYKIAKEAKIGKLLRIV
jgi:alanine dehydrogenase